MLLVGAALQPLLLRPLLVAGRRKRRTLTTCRASPRRRPPPHPLRVGLPSEPRSKSRCIAGSAALLLESQVPPRQPLRPSIWICVCSTGQSREEEEEQAAREMERGKRDRVAFDYRRCLLLLKVPLLNLDDTLHPLSAGVNLACRKNIQESQIAEICLELYRGYGTKALGYKFDNDEFHANVHGRLPYDNLRHDPFLRTLLLSIPQRKIRFTNSDKVHAEKVLRRLDLQDCFEGVICFETLNPPAMASSDLCKSRDPRLICIGLRVFVQGATVARSPPCSARARRLP